MPEAIQQFPLTPCRRNPINGRRINTWAAPTTPRAWPHEAMGAYERMIELNPNDPALREWVNQFKLVSPSD